MPKKKVPPYKIIPVKMREHLGELTGNELKVWMYFFLRTGEELTSFPSNQLVADDLKINRETVKDAKAGLRVKGWSLREFQRRREDGTLSTVVEKTITPWGKNTATDDGKSSHGTVAVKTVDGKSSQQKVYTKPSEEPASPYTEENLEGSASPLESELVSKSVTSPLLEQLDSYGSSPAKQEPELTLDTIPDFETLDGVVYNTGQVYAQMCDCFPAFKQTDPTVAEVLLMQEIIAACDNQFIYAKSVLAYAKKHKRSPKEAGLIPRSIKHLHKAICGKDASTTNGLLMQAKEHDPQNCGICLMEIKNKTCDRCGKTPVVFNYDGTATFCAQCAKVGRSAFAGRGGL